MNRHVERAVKLLEGKDKRFFIHAYRRSGRYRPAIVRALNEAGLPEELSWLPLIESGFKVHALSRSRALGLWQFIASTGYKFGLSRDRWIDERMDPKKSTKAAIAYLKELHQIFGDWTTALAAYNCGEGTVLRAIRTQKINYLDNFWDLYQKLPLETAFYVPKFLAVLHILNDPAAHGITLPPLDPEIESEEVAIEKQVHLKTVAKYIDMSYKELRDLNPELRYNFTPDTPYILNVPKGKGELFLAKIGDIPTWHPPVPAYVVHRVRRGESLSTIASRYGTSVRSIMARNGLRSSHYIKAGWKLKIPTRGTYRSNEKASLPLSDFRVKGEFIEYVVQKGDSLWKIAGRFGTTTKTIQSINQLNNTHLRIGQVLRIPKGVGVAKDIKTKTYRVLKGDTAFVIAQKHQMDLSEFLSLNHLTPRSTIFPGQVMLVKAE
jgi:membrane-bound lytic murein transglycosylase D